MSRPKLSPNQQRAIRLPGYARTSKYKGVSYFKLSKIKPWRATIMMDGVQKYIGCFADPEDAAMAYDLAAIKAWGTECYLNFPKNAKKNAG